MRRRVVLAAGCAALAALAAGCGGDAARPSGDGAGVFVTRVLREEISGQWARQWRELHPGHRRLISQAQYVACSRRMGTDFATGHEIFRVLDVRTDAIRVRDVPERTSKLVTITFREPGAENGLTYRLHAVSVGGRWTWILGGRFLSQLARGRCLDGSPLPPRA